jgi:hypothetical protein
MYNTVHVKTWKIAEWSSNCAMNIAAVIAKRFGALTRQLAKLLVFLSVFLLGTSELKKKEVVDIEEANFEDAMALFNEIAMEDREIFEGLAK